MAGLDLQPLGDEPLARVQVHLTEPPCPRVRELVRHAGRNHHDLATRRLYRLVSCRERNAALLDEEDFLVRMPMAFLSASRRRIYNDDRDGGVMIVPLNLVRVVAVSGVG